MINIKIQRFLITFQDILLNYPDISISSLRKVIKEFEYCLSNKELENQTTVLLLRVINEIGIKQISLKTAINNHNYERLEIEYNKLKEGKMNIISCRAETEGHCSFDCKVCCYESIETKEKFQKLNTSKKSK